MARRCDIRLCLETDTVFWRLSVSKTDPAALGCERSWGCICTQDGSLGCPFHAAVAQLTVLEATFPEAFADGSVPLFPTAAGKQVTDTDWMKFVDDLAAKVGELLCLPSGVRRYGKHSFRSTGAVILTSLRIELFRIQLLARWASPVIMHYARNAPLEALTGLVKEAITTDSLGT